MSIKVQLNRPKPPDLYRVFREAGIQSSAKVVIDANKLDEYLYPAVREALGKRYTGLRVLDEKFLDILADQSIRHTVHRLTFERNNSHPAGNGDFLFLKEQMRSCGYDLVPQFDQIVLDAHRIASDIVKYFELDGNDVQIEIWGQTP